MGETFACRPSDLSEIGEEGYLGLLYCLVEFYGWRVTGRRKARGDRVVLTAHGSGYTHSVSGEDDAEAATRLFCELVSDEPDALAVGAGAWPPPKSNVVPLREDPGGS